MHVEKNVVDAAIGTILDISSKTKDHAKGRYDLKEMKIRKSLHPKDTTDGKRIKIAKACFSMTNGEKSIFCRVLKKAKLPDESTSNISRCVQLDERKLSGYKTHDAHFMLHYLLPIPIKNILPDHVAIALIRLSSFFRRLCQKVITVEEIDCLEAKIIETINRLEKIFPPTFFDIMIHLPIHLANEVRLGGPVQNQWMYLSERDMCTFKSYVRNKNYPEGSITEAYLVEECLTLCSRYLHTGIRTRFNKRPQNDNEYGSGDAPSFSLFPCKDCPLGAKKNAAIILDKKEHELEVNGQPRRLKWSKAKNHSQNFSKWFETRALQDDVPDLIKEFSRGPNAVAKRYSGYLINGYRFHIRQCNARRKTQNSGVTLVASTTSFASSKDKNPVHADLTYYGRIVDILELDYYGHFKVVLFKCDWYEVEKDTYSLTYVYFNKKCSLKEPFVLASQVHQCFYVQDQYDQDRHYVMKTVPRDLFNVSDHVESTTSESFENEPSEQFMSPSIPNDNGEVVLIRNDVPETIIDVDAEGFLAEQHEVEHDSESEDVYEEEYEEEFADDSEEEPGDYVDVEDEP
ncbi:uncharacterized protein LOC124898104 [Capsicum annuum]|uniref:uncharacterized protein LOC124898104 n=1 Tax=Capsicum annuum TaxID=4072 RepID=UPI001FB074B6|nr:uncharacterized protein LOC124898104 [Capsicum annuum]